MLSRLIKIVGSIGLLSLFSAAPALAQYPSPTYNNLTVLGTINGHTPGVVTITGDCTGSGSFTLAVTCLKTNGVAFTSAATTAVGTNGATIPLLNGANTWAALQTFSGGIATTTINGYLPTFGALFSSVNTASANAGTTYSPGDLVTLSGGINTTPAVLSIIATQVIAGTVSAGGTGGTTGACTVTDASATAGTVYNARSQFTGTISGGALTGSLLVSVPGAYAVVNPTSPIPVTGCGLTGATVAVTYGALGAYVQQVGAYSQLPANPVAQASTTGSGTGATWNISWGPIASTVSFPGLSYSTGGNTYLGYQAGNAQTVGTENTFYGAYAGLNITSGGFNTAVGHRALGSDTTGSSNVAVGEDAMRDYVGRSTSIAIGDNADREIASHDIIAVGDQALRGPVAGDIAFPFNMIAIGSQAGLGAGVTTASNDIFIGISTVNDTAWTTASSDIFIGNASAQNLTTGSNNVGVGHGNSVALTTGFNNVAIGAAALTTSQTGAGITAIGYQALKSLVNSSDDTVIGQLAAANIVGGSSQVIIGSKAVGASTGSPSNIVVAGYQAGNNVTGGNNTLLGASVAATLTSGTNNLLLGTNSSCDIATAATSNTISLCAGSSAVISVTGAGTPSTSVATVAGLLTVTGATTISSNTINFTGSTFSASGCTSLTVAASTGALGCTVSDRRLKIDGGVFSDDDALSDILAMPDLHTYQFQYGHGPGGHFIGYFAQDVQSVHPGWVLRGAATDLTPDGVLQYDQNHPTPELVGAVKALSRKVDHVAAGIPSDAIADRLRWQQIEIDLLAVWCVGLTGYLALRRHPRPTQE